MPKSWQDINDAAHSGKFPVPVFSDAAYGSMMAGYWPTSAATPSVASALPEVPLAPTDDVTISAGASVVVVRSYTVTRKLSIGLGGRLRVL